MIPLLKAWVRIDDRTYINPRQFTDAVSMTLGELDEGRWTIIVSFQDGRVTHIGNFENFEKAVEALQRLTQTLAQMPWLP